MKYTHEKITTWTQDKNLLLHFAAWIAVCSRMARKIEWRWIEISWMKIVNLVYSNILLIENLIYCYKYMLLPLLFATGYGWLVNGRQWCWQTRTSGRHSTDEHWSPLGLASALSPWIDVRPSFHGPFAHRWSIVPLSSMRALVNGNQSAER